MKFTLQVLNYPQIFNDPRKISLHVPHGRNTYSYFKVGEDKNC